MQNDTAHVCMCLLMSLCLSEYYVARLRDGKFVSAIFGVFPLNAGEEKKIKINEQQFLVMFV